MSHHLTADEYQRRCADTAIYRSKFPSAILLNTDLDKWHGLSYCASKLSAEAGELLQHVAKAQRDEGFVLNADRYQSIFGELGDVLWYVAMICNELGFRMEDVMDHNLAKLKSRQDRGKLHGSGSER